MTRSMLCRRAPFVAAAVASLLLAASPEARAADVWQPLGPSGGTVAAVAIDPADSNTVYAGSLRAGVWKSANGGRSWQPMGLDGGVTWLAVAPGSRAVYAMTGFGLFRSRDGGASWTDLSAPFDAALSYIRSLALPPAQGTLYAVVSESPHGIGREIWKSTDGGDSWRPAWVPPSGVFVMGVFTDPSDPQAVFAGTSRGVYASADAGATWTAGDFRMEIFAIAVEAGPRHRLMALVEGDPRHPETTLQVSSDRGKTWRPRGGPQNQPISFLRADPTAPGAFVTLSYRGDLYRTTDAGIHWTSLGLVPRRFDNFDLALDPHRAGVAYLATAGERFGRGLWKTASFGAAWTPFFRGLEVGDFVALTPDPARPETLWAGTSSVRGEAASPLGLWTSLDRGLTWTQTAFPADGVPAIVPTSRSLFAAVAGQGLQRSDDGGLHWTRAALAANDVQALVAPPEEPDTLYALAIHPIGRALDVSLDDGATWTTRPLSGATILAVAPGAPATLYANADNFFIPPLAADALRRSTDRGATWATILQVEHGFLLSLGLDPADPRRIVVAYDFYVGEGYQLATALQWTADGGATWNGGDLFLPIRTSAPGVLNFLPDPLVPHGFLAGTSDGAFRSADGGAHWTRLGEGLQRTSTHLSLDPSSPSTVYAATEGGGIYRLERTNP